MIIDTIVPVVMPVIEEIGKAAIDYVLWNRLLSGAYFQKPIRGVGISKKNGKLCRKIGNITNEAVQKYI